MMKEEIDAEFGRILGILQESEKTSALAILQLKADLEQKTRRVLDSVQSLRNMVLKQHQFNKQEVAAVKREVESVKRRVTKLERKVA